MASSGQTIITGIEFGTDKICVIHGRPDQNGNIEVLSFASQPSRNSIVKGTVVDQNAVLNILKSVLDESEKGLGWKFSRTEQQVYFLVNGMHVSSRFGEGTVLNYNEDRKITAAHVQKAIDSAKNLAVSTDLVNIQVYDSSFLLDGSKRTFNPIGSLAEKLTAIIHIVFADKKRIDMVQTILRELGFESGYPVFAPLADAYGVLTQDERNQGTLLFDYGAGVCSYVLLYREGVLLSGSIPTGANNVANDLSVALELPYEYCQKFLRESRLKTLRGEGKNYVEYKVSGGGPDKIRRIPLDSFEKVMDLRQRETFTLLKKELERAGMLSYLRNSVVMTGGGSMIDSAPGIMMNVMNVPVRCGEAMNVTGALSAFRSPMPCYSAILGLVKHAAALEEGSPSAGGGLRRTVVHATDQFLQGLQNLGKAFKI